MQYFKQRGKAVGHALRGLAQAFRREHHLRLHGLAAVGVVVIGLGCNLARWEWVAISAAVTLVIVLELMNSAVERLCDLVMPNEHLSVKYIKDVCAGAVLVSCLFALVVAGLIFLPRLVPGS